MDRIDLKAGPPPVPLALVEWLEAVYPDRFPKLDITPPHELHRLAGCLEVVRLLRDHAQRQMAGVRPRSPF
jgi:hypothetical protein